MKPRFVLDVDEVLANLVDPLLEQIGGRLKRADITDYAMAQFMSEEEKRVMYDVMSKPDFWHHLEPISGAVAGVETLRKKFEIVFATAPWLSCREWASVRCDWLKRHFDASATDIVICSRKELVVGEFMMDDKPENVSAWQKANARGVAFMFTQPWNKETPWPQRFGGWK